VSLQLTSTLTEVPNLKHHPHFVSGETEVGVWAVGAFDEAISAPAHPELWSLAHPPLAPAT
jgi:hypothetical protein